MKPEYDRHIINSYLIGGYTLFPLTRRKKPRYEGWRKTQYDPLLDPDDLPESFGVLLQHDDFIVDYDTKREDKDRNQLKELWTKLDLPPADTFIVKTVNNGFQLYFKKPPNLIIKGNTRLPEFPAIDIKKVGGYVVGATSVAIDKNDELGTYTIVRHSPEEVQEAPAPLLDYLAKLVITHPGTTDFENVNDDGTKFQYTRFLLDVRPAIEGENGNDHTYFVACKGRDLGLSEDVVSDLMLRHFNHKCVPPWEVEDLQKVVAHAFNYAQNRIGVRHVSADFKDQDFTEYKNEFHAAWDRDRNDKLISTIHNTANFLKMPFVNLQGGVDVDTVEVHRVPNPLNSMLRYNVFTERVEFTKKAPWHKTIAPQSWTDHDTKIFRYWLSTNQHYNTSKELCEEAALAVADQNSYHPIKQYAETLKWDGEPRLDNMLHRYAGALDADFVREMSKNTMIAAWARIYRPGCKHDHILVLEGEEQGQGKSTFVETLGTACGPYYKSFNVQPKEKDTIAYMRGAWFIEMAEMTALNLEDLEAMKAFITRGVDTTRLSYDRFEGDRPRQSVFIGTTNKTAAEGYLRDRSGNRRFWTVHTSDFDIAGLRRDRDQLFAEAFHRFKNGEPWWIIDRGIEEKVKAEQARRLEVDAWEDLINEYLQNLMSQEDMPVITTSLLIQYALMLPISRVRRNEQLRVAQIMKDLGFKNSVTYDRVSDRKLRGWILDTGV